MASPTVSPQITVAFFFSDTRKRGFRIVHGWGNGVVLAAGMGAGAGAAGVAGAGAGTGAGNGAGMPGSGGRSPPVGNGRGRQTSRRRQIWHGQRGFLILGFLPSAQTQWTHLVPRDGKPPLNLTAC